VGIGCRGTSYLGGDMAQARRAIGQRRSNAAILFTVVAVILLIVGLLIIFGLRRQADLGNLPISQDSSTSPSISSAPTSTAATAPTSTGPAQDNSADAALKACRENVAAADRVLTVGKEGMRNWSDHIQAQTDANAGKITTAEMEETFDRTMKAGDEDEDRYAGAIRAHRETRGSCDNVPGASTEVANQLKRCAERSRAQQPVLSAVQTGMADWTKHLNEMRRSARGQIHNPAERWLQTWRAAPRNINAYKRAVDRFSAPDC
jgi:hypothetical protein